MPYSTPFFYIGTRPPLNLHTRVSDIHKNGKVSINTKKYENYESSQSVLTVSQILASTRIPRWILKEQLYELVTKILCRQLPNLYEPTCISSAILSKLFAGIITGIRVVLAGISRNIGGSAYTRRYYYHCATHIRIFEVCSLCGQLSNNSQGGR